MKAVSETIAFTFEEVIFPVIRFTTSLFSASTAWVANSFNSASVFFFSSAACFCAAATIRFASASASLTIACF